MLNIKRAYSVKVEEKTLGGYNYTEHHIEAENGELILNRIDDLWFVTSQINGTLHFDRFPAHNMNRRLWQALYGEFRNNLKKQG